ncbi:MAG: sigma-70 family RNA polymerase sigma factor [Burkholderiaceae bacterium]|nr:sigma-70 family RNA polymerase sigma factor [Rhodoferax sp.]MCP5285677.1 sigma-70 family RNA polymerase sigma factor [Burkholderiaceae bacterium]
MNAPPADESGSLTLMLGQWRDGNADAFERIVHALHGEFQRMAGARLRGWGDASLSRGDLVNEALMRLLRHPAGWENRAHFFATVSLTMRSVLREHARARLADKRHGGERLSLTLAAGELGQESMAADLLTLDALLTQFDALDPRASQVLQLTYFTGLGREDIAEVMALSLRTVDRELRFARAWMQAQLGRGLEA